jgi:hypothetical protein
MDADGLLRLPRRPCQTRLHRNSDGPGTRIQHSTRERHWPTRPASATPLLPHPLRGRLHHRSGVRRRLMSHLSRPGRKVPPRAGRLVRDGRCVRRTRWAARRFTRRLPARNWAAFAPVRQIADVSLASISSCNAPTKMSRIAVVSVGSVPARCAARSDRANS